MYSKHKSNINIINKYMKYLLHDFNKDVPSQEIAFYEMNEDGTTESGTTLEEMLKVSFIRLTELNNKFPCEDNISALSHIGSAVDFLNKRTEDRVKRGVEGKHEA